MLAPVCACVQGTESFLFFLNVWELGARLPEQRRDVRGMGSEEGALRTCI